MTCFLLWNAELYIYLFSDVSLSLFQYNEVSSFKITKYKSVVPKLVSGFMQSKSNEASYVIYLCDEHTDIIN